MTPTHATTEDVQLVFTTVADLTTERHGLDKLDLVEFTNLPLPIIQDAIAKLAGIVVPGFGTHSRGPVYRLASPKKEAV